MSETKPKKMVRRSVTIALGIVCILLIAGLGGALVYYINDKNNTISALDIQISNLQGQVSGINDSLNLNETEFWTNGSDGWVIVNQTAGSYSSWNFSVPYARALRFNLLGSDSAKPKNALRSLN